MVIRELSRKDTSIWHMAQTGEKGGFCRLAGLEDLIAANLEEDADMEEDPDIRQDPISSIDILEYIAVRLRGFAAAYPDQFNACCQQLGPDRLKPLTYLFPSG